MKRIPSYLFILLVLFPISASAFCSTDGYTVIYVNGIWTDKDSAGDDTNELQRQFNKHSNLAGAVFLNGYNPSHLGGAGDLLQSIAQAFGSPISNYDLETILTQIHSQVTTRKILLLGHSQGTFYTNEMYNYLVDHGVPKKSIAVYNVATPESFVSGGGGYLTSTNDKVINDVRDKEVNGNLQVYVNSYYVHTSNVVNSALRANITLPKEPDWDENTNAGHAFGDVYLSDAADRIVHDINGELGALQADANTETDGCFTPPSPSIVHTIEGAIFAVADPTLGPMIDKSVGAARNAYATVRNTVSALASGISSLRGVLAFGSNNAQASAAALSLDGQLHLTPRPTIVLDEQEQVVESAAAEPIQSTHVTTAPNDIPPSASAADLPMPETSPSIPQVMISPGFGGGGGGANSTPVQDSQQEQTSIPSLSITSPLDGEIFGTTSVEFVGTVDAGAVVTVTFSTGSASTTADGAGNWSLPLAFNEGAFQIDVSATDGRGNSSATVSRTITVDLTPPAVPILSVTTCDASLLVGDCLVATTTVDISWGDVAGASYYAVATNGVLGATTSLLSSQAMLADGATSTITVVAYDAAGNAATSTSVDVAAISQPLIINEIGWGGTDTDPTNQWIEIKNASPYTLNLSHVELTRSSGSPIQLSGSLPPTLNQNFLVVAPGDTNFFGAHTLTVNFALATTTAEQLSLVWNSSTTLDVTPAVSTCAGWCAGSHNATLGSNVSGLSDLVSPLSMERKTNTDGALASSWQNTDSYGPWLGTGAGLWGSPGIENSAGLPEAGVYCGSTSNLLAPGAPPGPSFGPGNDCVFLSKFVTGSTFGAVRFGGVFRGDIASSTGGSISLFKGLASGMAVNVQSQDPEPGEHYFFAVWENRSFGNDSFVFNFYFTQGASSTQGIAGPPHGNYVIIPFTYAP